MVAEGHIIGDHSYDHMAHNTIGDSPRSYYYPLRNFSLWKLLTFQKRLCGSGWRHILVWPEKHRSCHSCIEGSRLNSVPQYFVFHSFFALYECKEWLKNKILGYQEDAINFVTNTMWNNIRLPFSNNWRVGPIKHDCYPCTVPASSGKWVFIW